MRTKTIRFQTTTPAMVVEVNRQETDGWAVRQILAFPDKYGYIVVFEKEN